jgi:CheY-like chemotaxis protein
MNGQLRIESTAGVGSRFYADLPLPAHTPAPVWPPLKGRVVVVSTAGSGLVELLSGLLPDWGIDYRHFSANDPQPDVQPDLLITDCPECLIGIRPATRIPVLLVTAYGNFMPAEQVVALAPLQQQARPLSRVVLHQALSRILLSEGQRPGVRQTVEQPLAHRARILLVEDNPVNQLVAKGMLSKLGCEVVVTSHGGEALQQLERGQFDLVLMDCNMPVMDGYEATRLIRQSGKWPGLPIIALTANAMPEEREHCKNAGMNDYLAKPFHREELNYLLEQWIAVVQVNE